MLVLLYFHFFIFYFLKTHCFVLGLDIMSKPYGHPRAFDYFLFKETVHLVHSQLSIIRRYKENKYN